MGAVAVISACVLKASSGIVEVNPKQSYEPLMLKYPDRFEEEVIEMEKEQSQEAHALRTQDIQFFIKTSSFELFKKPGVTISKDDWIGREAIIPDLLNKKDYLKPVLTNGFCSFIWFHEQENHGEKGRGLSAVVQFGPINNKNSAQIIDVEFFDYPVGKDMLEARKDDNKFLAEIDGYRLTCTRPIIDSNESVLLEAVRNQVCKIASYENHNPDPSDEQNLEKIEETTGLRKIVLRRNQSAFRKALLAKRPKHCAISQTSETSVLEAAHIIPYSEKFAERDKLENGLLLRSDIHKLFDAHLIAINPETKAVEVAECIQSPDYIQFRGKIVKDDVSIENLGYHFELFNGKTLG